MVQFLLKLLLKQRFLAVHHDFHSLLVAKKWFTAKLHSRFVTESESGVGVDVGIENFGKVGGGRFWKLGAWHFTSHSAILGAMTNLVSKVRYLRNRPAMLCLHNSPRILTTLINNIVESKYHRWGKARTVESAHKALYYRRSISCQVRIFNPVNVSKNVQVI